MGFSIQPYPSPYPGTYAYSVAQVLPASLAPRAHASRSRLAPRVVTRFYQGPISMIGLCNMLRLYLKRFYQAPCLLAWHHRIGQGYPDAIELRLLILQRASCLWSAASASASERVGPPPLRRVRRGGAGKWGRAPHSLLTRAAHR